MSRYTLIEEINFYSASWELYEENNLTGDDGGKDGKFLHYRSLDAFNSILEGGYLRAYDIRFMNDESEYEFGLKLLQGKEDERIRQIVKARTFVPMSISFSTAEESIPQWEMYAKEAGINLQFDFSSFTENGDVFIGQESNRKNYYINTFLKKPIPVTYIKESDESKLDRLIKIIDNAEQWQNVTKSWIMDIMPMLLAPLIKNKDFDFEHEARLVTFASSKKINSIGGGTKIHYDFNGTYLRSYVNLCFCKRTGKILKDKENDLPPAPEIENIGLPIKKLQIGPGRDQEKVFDSVVRRLELGEVKVCPISISTFLERLTEYVQKIFNHFELDENDAKSIVYALSPEDERKEMIDCNEYDKAKNILEELHRKIIQDICPKNASKKKKREAEEKLKEFEKRNYFSWYGFTVYTSQKAFSFV